MKFTNQALGLAAALATTIAGLGLSTSAQAVPCAAKLCQCSFNWNTSNNICQNDGIVKMKADLIQGKTLNNPTVYHTEIRLVAGVSSSNIPVSQNGTVFPEACRVSDGSLVDGKHTRECPASVIALTPFTQRVAVGL